MVLRAQSWRLPGPEGPEQPHSVRAVAWCMGQVTLRAAASLWLTHRSSTASRFISTLSSPGLFRQVPEFPRFKAQRARSSVNRWICLFCLHPLPRTRTGPGQSWREIGTAGIQQLDTKSEVGRGESSSLGRKGDKTRTARLERHGRQRRRTASGVRSCVMPRAGPGGRETTPRRPALRPALCPDAAH